MLRRDVLKCFVMGLIFPIRVSKSRILVTIRDHSDEKPFLVKIEGDDSTLLTLRSELQETGGFRYSAELPVGSLNYHVNNQMWEDVFLTVFERYDNVDYKLEWSKNDQLDQESVPKKENILDKGISLKDWLVASIR